MIINCNRKNTLLKLLISTALIFILFGCNSKSTTKNDIVIAIDEQKDETIVKSDPDKLITEARSYLATKEYKWAKLQSVILMKDHPNSLHAKEAKIILEEADRGIQQQQSENEKSSEDKLRKEKENYKNTLKKLRSKYDDIEEITWYHDKSTPQSISSNSFNLYMGKGKAGLPWLRFRIQYTASDWLFIESYTLKTDNNSYSIPTTYGAVKTDHGAGDIWEWYDVVMTDELYTIVKDVIGSKSAKIRHNGKQYYKDRIISKKEKQGLQNILEGYEALGGISSFN